jgi:hypothetical protein
MPTAAMTNADSDSSLISKKGTADLSTLTQAARGPVYGGHLCARPDRRARTRPACMTISLLNTPFSLVSLNWHSASAFRTRLSPTLKSPMNLQTIFSVSAAIRIAPVRALPCQHLGKIPSYHGASCHAGMAEPGVAVLLGAYFLFSVL